MSEFRIAALAALFGSLVVAPAFAQDVSTVGCSDYNSMTAEQQLETVEALMMVKMGTEGTPETNAEVVSLLLEQCQEFPDTPAMSQFDELPLAVQ